jgi:undecaprenyl-diphosphatase
MRGLRLLLLTLWVPLSSLAATTAEQPQEVTAEEARAQFTPTRVVVTGVVEGVTEFLPVSSTGHMIISDRLLGVDADAHKVVRGVVDRKGRPVTLNRVADDYIVIIQFGAILAVLVVFFARLRELGRGLLRLDPAALALGRSIAIAFLPAAALGYLLKEYIPLSWKQALTIGLCQCVALIPGTSRSLATILGGRWAGLSSAAATEFSFLVGLAILSAASLYKAYAMGPALSQVYPLGSAGLGLVIAAVAAFLSVKWMVGFIMRRGMGPFAWYRIALGAAILVWRVTL